VGNQESTKGKDKEYLILADDIERLIAIFEERIKELQQLADDARELQEAQLSKDTEQFLLHRAEIIGSETMLLRKQFQRLIKFLEK
jgi:hypothetical protein